MTPLLVIFVQIIYEFMTIFCRCRPCDIIAYIASSSTERNNVETLLNVSLMVRLDGFVFTDEESNDGKLLSKSMVYHWCRAPTVRHLALSLEDQRLRQSSPLHEMRY
jgi:hypothetical protein